MIEAADAGESTSLASTLGLLQLALAGKLREERETATPWTEAEGDCCAAVGAEVYPDQHTGAELDDWRLWLSRSSLPTLRVRDAAYLCVRVLLAAAMDAVLAWSVLLFQQGHPGTLGWMIYRACVAVQPPPPLTRPAVTHWTLAVECFYLTASVLGALVARRSLARQEAPPPRPLWLPLLWTSRAIAMPGSLLVFVLFWGLLYPGDRQSAQQPVNYGVHAANFGIMALDALVSDAPFPFLYVWTGWVPYAFVYVLFTITFSQLGGRDAFGNPYVYNVLAWGTAAGAASAGILAGVIVLVVVPLLGLCCFCVLFHRRKQLTAQPVPPSVPGCAPPAGPATSFISRAADALPMLRLLPVLGILVVGATLAASTPLMLIIKSQTYWRGRQSRGAIVPYISDSGSGFPSYPVFAAGLTLSAGILLAVFRLVYERMDPHLAAIDTAGGRFGRRGQLLSQGGKAPLAAPLQQPQMRAEVELLKPATLSARVTCLHCCCCCTQSLRQQGRAAYIMGAASSAGLPLLGWVNVHYNWYIHSLGAATTFLCIYLHIIQLARLSRAKAAAVEIFPQLLPIRGSRANARLKTALVAAPPLLVAAVVAVYIAWGPLRGALFNAYLAPLLEWAYAGVLAVYIVSLTHETSLGTRTAATCEELEVPRPGTRLANVSSVAAEVELV